MRSDSELAKMLEGIYWDYNVSGDSLLLTARTADMESLEYKRIFVRTFERLKWVFVLEIFGSDKACAVLFDDSIRKMIRPQLRGRYDRYRAVLLGQPLPDADKCIEFHRQISESVFPNRRYGS